jgi:acyl-CoA synthetase (AMP-forming)/AMP-acid ligase II
MEISRSERTLPEVIRANAALYPDRPFLVHGDRRLTFAEFDAAVLDAARALTNLGVGSGDSVGVWGPNSIDWLVAAMGVFATQAMLLPLNSRMRGAEVAEIVRRAGTKHIVTVDTFHGDNYPAMLRAAAPDADLTIIDLTSSGAAGTLSWSEVLANGCAAISEEQAAATVAAIDPDTISDVVFSSGTTGIPKGVIFTHRQNVESWGSDYLKVPRLGPKDTMLLSVPLGLLYGLKAIFTVGALAGATVVIQTMFDPAEAMQLIQDFGITYLPGPPLLASEILDAPTRPKYDLSSIRHVHLAGTTIPPTLVRRIREENFSQAITVGYGLSECAPTTLTKPDDEVETIATTVGRPVEGVTIKLVDDDDQEVAVGEAGEILVKSPWVTRGYLGDPEQTAAAFTADGWMRTGDTGSLDERGYLRIVGRKKDMFIVGGFNVYPAEVERCLMEFGGLAEVAVVPVPHQRLDQVGCAFVVPAPGIGIDAEELTAWVRARLANYKVPRHVEIVDELPKNASSKLLRAELRVRAEHLTADGDT